MLKNLLSLIHPFRKRHFLYKSVELKDYETPHLCDVLGEINKTRVMISIAPAFPKEVYGLSEDLGLAVLMPRYEGFNFFPSWFQKTMTVNLLIADTDKGGTLEKGPWRILDIGDLSPISRALD